MIRGESERQEPVEVQPLGRVMEPEAEGEAADETEVEVVDVEDEDEDEDEDEVVLGAAEDEVVVGAASEEVVEVLLVMELVLVLVVVGAAMTLFPFAGAENASRAYDPPQLRALLPPQGTLQKLLDVLALARSAVDEQKLE